MKKLATILIILAVVWYGYKHYFHKKAPADRQTFAMDIKYQKDLDKSVISPEMRRSFQDQGYSLSANAAVEVKKSENQWLIHDGGKEYSLIKVKNSIHVTGAGVTGSLDHGQPALLDAGEENDGTSLYQKCRFQDAIAKFAGDPGNPRSLAYTAMCHRYLGENEEARKIWEKLLEDFAGSPYEGAAHYFLAQYAKQGDLMESYRKSLAEAARYYSGSFHGAMAALELGDHYWQAGNKLEAWKYYSMAILGNFPQETKMALKARLEQLVQEVLLASKPDLEFCEIYVAQPGDNLTKIGKKYALAPGLIRMLNPNKQDNQVKQQENLKVVRGPVAITIGKKSYILVVHLANENFPPYYLRGYEVGLGKDDRTPISAFDIVERMPNPAWYEGGKKIPFGDPRNPLGTRWLGFDDKPGLSGFGIHGTSEPDSIGKNMSQGCVRMRNEEVEALFELIPLKTRVNITAD